jgi:hypothetical protein
MRAASSVSAGVQGQYVYGVHTCQEGAGVFFRGDQRPPHLAPQSHPHSRHNGRHRHNGRPCQIDTRNRRAARCRLAPPRQFSTFPRQFSTRATRGSFCRPIPGHRIPAPDRFPDGSSVAFPDGRYCRPRLERRGHFARWPAIAQNGASEPVAPRGRPLVFPAPSGGSDGALARSNGPFRRQRRVGVGDRGGGDGDRKPGGSFFRVKGRGDRRGGGTLLSPSRFPKVYAVHPAILAVGGGGVVLEAWSWRFSGAGR